jgi:hypothetical protein
MRMFYGWSAAWPQVLHQASASRITNRGKPGVLGLRIIAFARYAKLRGGQLSVTDEQVVAMITHPVAAPQRQLPLPQTAVVVDVSSAGCVPRPRRRE